MKNIFTLISFLLLVQYSNAQLQNNSIAPDFTALDIDGNEHHLYSLLDEGKVVILDVFATWCGPCWSYHDSGVLKDIYNSHGPDGDNTVEIFAIEGDSNTSVEEIYNSTLGDWTAGVPYPIMDNSFVANNLYNINYFPTLYIIYPNRIVNEMGQRSESEIEELLILSPPVTTGVNAAVLKFIGYNGGTCASVYPLASKYFINNMGTENITSATFKVISNGQEIYTENWTGDVATYGILTEVDTDVFIANENVTIEFKIEDVNGGVDDNLADNVHSSGISFELNNVIRVTGEVDFRAELDDNRYEIIDENGKVLKSEMINTPFQTFDNEHVLSAEGCYEIVFYDLAANGINGNIKAYDGNGNIIYSNEGFEEIDIQEFKVSMVSDVADVLSDKQVLLTPNPSNGFTNLSFEGLYEGNYVLEIIDNAGKKVLQEQLIKTTYKSIVSLDLTDYENGLYFVRIITSDSQMNRKLIVE